MAVLSVSALAQRRPDVKPTVQGILFLPVALGNPIFDNLTAVLGQVEGSFQLPVYKGFGAGVGVNATWYELNEFGLSSQVPTDGDVRRMLYFAKLNWTRYTGNSTFLEFSTKLGQSTWLGIAAAAPKMSASPAFTGAERGLVRPCHGQSRLRAFTGLRAGCHAFQSRGHRPRTLSRPHGYRRTVSLPHRGLGLQHELPEGEG
ncbi:MAG: hypothetical protein IPI95_07935 [Flavobacteriales bacterium]|nr:hypothetical protein [Flavobacteriales bacterium]